MASSGPLSAWLSMPVVTGKRKVATVDDSDDGPSTKTIRTSNAKKAKTGPKKASTGVKSKGKKDESFEDTTDATAAKKLYTTTLQALDKDTAALDRKVKAMPPNSRSITTDTYAASIKKYLPIAK